MPPDRGRASRACTSCRKQKTRCYEPDIPGKACLRCERLRQDCSLAHIGESEEESVIPTPGTDARLKRLEKTVATLLDRLGEGPAVSTEHESSKSGSEPTSPEHSDESYKEAASSGAPIMVIRDLATDSTAKPTPDIKSLGAVLDDLIPPDLALTLLTMYVREGGIDEDLQVYDSSLSSFLEHYGRWILFDPEADPSTILPRMRRSHFLFGACCLIAVRHISEEIAATLAPKLYECVRSFLSHILLVAPQGIEFFQATLILCMWSTTVGQVPLSIDSWLLSGFALQHSQSSPLFTAVTTQSQPPSKADEKALDRCFLWNHLCLAHLHYCVGTSRPSMIQSWQIERCRVTTNSDRATNFEVRMVAEIHLYWTVYEQLTEESVDLLKSVAALQTWRRKWEFVLEQPRSQFLSMGFHFSNLLLHENVLKSKSARPREPIVSEMVRHATSIVRLAMDTVDERTRHLSDHIYHMITFAAIVICRLLHSHESLLASSYSIVELDTLVDNLVQWLHSIGLPCHAAHTLGDIIAKVHQKLRPHVDTSSMAAHMNVFPEESFTSYYFPEFLGLGTSADGNWDLLSDLTFFPPNSVSS